MKNYTLLLLLFFAPIPFTAYSQTGTNKGTTSSENTKYIFCELVQQSAYWTGGSRTTTFLVFGSKSTYPNQTEDSTYVNALNDGMDALNYMNQKGWELVFKNSRDTSTGAIESVYLLRKKTS